MKAAEADLLFIPGLGDSGPDHWQSRWLQRLSTGKRVVQADWHKPRLADWTARIGAEVEQAQRPVIALAHSLGVIALVHAAPKLPKDKVRAAFLVAPPTGEKLRADAAIDPAFADVPTAPLPFPSLLVASRNDSWASWAQSEAMALDWGAQILDAGEAGHINAESGHGPWPEGLMRFAAFLGKL